MTPKEAQQVKDEAGRWIDRQAGGLTKQGKALRTELMHVGQRYWWACAGAIPVVGAIAFAIGRATGHC